MQTTLIKKLLQPNIKATLVRFPIPLLCSGLLTILLLATIKSVNLDNHLESWFYLLLVCAFFSYLALHLFFENHHIKKKFRLLLTLGLAIFLSSYAWQPNHTQILLYLTGSILLPLVAPFIANDIDETACCNFNTSMVGSVLFSVLATLTLCGGLSLALLSIQYLFGIGFEEISYVTISYIIIWVLGLAFFAPFYALSGFPSDFKSKEKTYPKGLAFIFSYILAPLLLGYFVILYAYITKIVIEWNFPRGNITYMVLIFGTVGILTHVFAYPIRETGTKALRLFYRYFYYALPAPIILVSIAIYIRVKTYGITESRYIATMLTLWFLFTCGYFIVKQQAKFKNIILAISALFIFSSFGFWGAVYLSGASQVARLQTILERNQILQDGKIKAQNEEIDYEDQKNISSIVEYLVSTDKFHLIKDWFDADSYIHKTKREYLKAYGIVDDIGIPYLRKWDIEQNQRATENLTHTIDLSFPGHIGQGVAMDVADFDYYINVGYTDIKQHDWLKVIQLPNVAQDHIQLFKFHDSAIGVRHPPTDVFLYIDLHKIISKFLDEGFQEGNLSEEESKSFVVTQAKDGLVVRLYIENISGKLRNKEPVISSINFAIAVKLPKD